ncbi:MAG: asparaginase [Clostridiaceae bacterium]|nr:asparaginase [Clostridiaceae bacterium]
MNLSKTNSKILILATGGTIASKATSTGFVPQMTGEELLRLIPEIASQQTIDVYQLMNIDSSDMQVSDWQKIARACQRAIEQKYKAIVITHGTDTMCYTASALSLLLPDLQIPIILTGSQKPAVLFDSDGPQNLRDSVNVANSHLKGVFIVFNRKIILGSRSYKMYSENYDAYISRNFPYVGYVRGKELQILLKPKIFMSKDIEGAFYQNTDQFDLCSEVELLKVTPATKPEILSFIGNHGYKGIVIEGFGTGGISNLNRGMLDQIKYLISRRNIPIIMISQCMYDGVNLAVYGVGDQAARAGVISGNDMTTEMAMVKLMWLLARTNDMTQIKEMIAYNFCDEISE